MQPIAQQVRAHYEAVWQALAISRQWDQGPTHQLPKSLHIAEFRPHNPQKLWTYATCGMSLCNEPLELHIHSPVQDQSLVELLTVIAHYHHTGPGLGLGHTVNFGRPWLPGSRCDRGVISLPHADGPRLESLSVDGGTVQCLWLIPITLAEVEFKAAHGLDALERRFESAQLTYWDVKRASIG